MTHPGGQPGPRPGGPAGPAPPRKNPYAPTAAEIIAAIDDDVRGIAAGLPELEPSMLSKVADIFRRNHRLRRLRKAA